MKRSLLAVTSALALGSLSARADPTPAPLHVRSFAAYVLAEPRVGATLLGTLRPGATLVLRGTERVRVPGCSAGFVPVVPVGWLCASSDVATPDPQQRYVRALRASLPAAVPAPFGGALADELLLYRRLPSAAEAERSERGLPAPGSRVLPPWEQLHAPLIVDAPAPGAMPFFLEQGGSASSSSPLERVARRIHAGTLLAFTGAVEHDGRRYLVGSDGFVFPAERVRVLQPSAFHGVEPTGAFALPLAFVRAQRTPLYDAHAAVVGHVDRYQPVPLTDAVADARTGRLRLRGDPPRFIDAAAVGVASAPASAPLGLQAGERWLHVRLAQGTLVAWDGARPVLATLVSPGREALLGRGLAATPRGLRHFTFKHRVSTLAGAFGAEQTHFVADVPYVQYFEAPYALHASYWHDRFGEPVSAGCLNVSPADALTLFDFTAPHVPEGWNGAAGHRAFGGRSAIFVER